MCCVLYAIGYVLCVCMHVWMHGCMRMKWLQLSTVSDANPIARVHHQHQKMKGSDAMDRVRQQMREAAKCVANHLITSFDINVTRVAILFDVGERWLTRQVISSANLRFPTFEREACCSSSQRPFHCHATLPHALWPYHYVLTGKRHTRLDDSSRGAG